MTDQSATPADTEHVNVQFFPCGHTYRMDRDTAADRCGTQLEQIESGEKLDAVILPASECAECTDERLRQERLCSEMDLRLNYEEAEEQASLSCGTCGGPLASTGPRARDEYCSDDCYRLASSAADEAADNRYI
jgi:hypothetical protein